MGQIFMLVALSSIALATPGQAQVRPDSSAVAHAIDRLEHQWATALVQQDTVLLQRLLAPEYVLVVSAAPERPVTRKAWFATLPDYHTESLKIRGLTVRVLGDLAIASFLGDLAARVRGAERRGSYFITDVWQRQRGSWRVVARYSSRPEDASPSIRALEQMGQDSAGER